MVKQILLEELQPLKSIDKSQSTPMAYHVIFKLDHYPDSA